MKTTGYLALAVGLLASALGVGSARAQTTLDVPTLSVVSRGYFRITVQVQAGPSGAPAGFSIDWMTRADYDLYGWSSGGLGTYRQYCAFTGDPTLNVDPASPHFALPSSGSVAVEIGDLFDETGLYATYSEHLPTNTEYVVRARALGDSEYVRSDYSPTVFVSTTNGECTQGFWKNHPEVWPSGCMPMTLGNVSYTQSQLLAILNQPAQGNGLIFLAHQLIATKLNICNGSNSSTISSTIAAADALIGNQVVPPVGTDSLPPSQASGNTQTLDDYNNGLIAGVANCPTPVEPSTWSSIKSIYR